MRTIGDYLMVLCLTVWIAVVWVALMQPSYIEIPASPAPIVQRATTVTEYITLVTDSGHREVVVYETYAELPDGSLVFAGGNDR